MDYQWQYLRRGAHGAEHDGELLHNNVMLGTGYSGHGDGLNNPEMEAIHNVGPIPAGFYKIGPFSTHERLGPMSAPLSPIEGTDTHGRDGFFIHGDNEAADFTASDGCIVLEYNLRKLIANAGSDQILRVV
jgi:hypothetical protein